MAICLSSLSALYRATGEYDKAEQLCLRAIAIYEKTSGPESSNVVDFVHTLAMIYYAQERYQEAEPLLQKALAFYEHTLGPEDSLTVKTRLWLMRLHQKQGEYAS